MASLEQDIERSLRSVAASRAAVQASAQLSAQVQAIKHWQQQRLAHTYADLAAQPRYAKTSAFFFSEIYGPGDFSQRDTQFERIVPTLVRLFPQDTVATVALLVRLHALAEELDLAMAQALGPQQVDAATYAQAWCTVGRPAERERQIDLLVQIGTALDKLTANFMLRQGVRLMRGAALAAGLGDLQSFLERGFEAFRAMGGADEFLATVAGRERALAQALFAGGAASAAQPPI